MKSLRQQLSKNEKAKDKTDANDCGLQTDKKFGYCECPMFLILAKFPFVWRNSEKKKN